ncbi:MAG: hypothetical protein FWG46_02865 [Treponema sp.]|nr:hypothetical protein [Treponema sp.]
MKTFKQPKAAAFFFLTVLVFAACTDMLAPVDNNNPPAGMGYVTVVLDYNASRTLTPTSPVLADFTRFELLFESAGKASVTEKFAAGQALTVALESAVAPGVPWKITVTAYRDITFATGEKEFEAATGIGYANIITGTTSTAVNIELEPVDISEFNPAVTGVFTYAITFLPAPGGAGITGDMILAHKDGKQNFWVPIESLPAIASMEIPAGEYDLSLTLTDSNGMKAGRYTAVQIYAGLETEMVNTQDLSFAFTADDFAAFIPIAGELRIDKPDFVNFTGSDNVTVSAWLDEGCSLTMIGDDSDTWPSGGWTNDTRSWFIELEPQNQLPLPPVYLKIEVSANDGAGSAVFTYRAPPLSGIGENGKAGISLDLEIFSISDGTTDSGITIRRNGSARKAAAPGDTIDFSFSPAVGYELKPGTLTVNGGAVAFSGTYPNYSITMPNENVTIAGNFVSHVNLSGNLVINKPGTVTPVNNEEYVTITAYSDPERTSSLPDVFSHIWDGSPFTGEWSLSVPIKTPAVYLTVEVTALDDGLREASYIYNCAQPVTGIMYDDVPGILIEMDIKSISVASTDGNILAERNGQEAKSAVPGDIIFLDPDPLSGFYFMPGSLEVEKENGGYVPVSLTDGKYHFTMPEDDVTITAEFLPVYLYIITLDVNGGGTVDVTQNGSPRSAANPGEAITLKVTPNPDIFDDLIVHKGIKGGEIIPTYQLGDQFIFFMPESDVFIEANFN